MSGVFSLAAVVASAAVHQWGELLACRLILGIGMAGKASVSFSWSCWRQVTKHLFAMPLAHLKFCTGALKMELVHCRNLMCVLDNFLTMDFRSYLYCFLRRQQSTCVDFWSCSGNYSWPAA